MKKKIILSHRIFLINKKYKKKEFYHYIKEPNNSLIIPVLNKKYFVLVIQKREPINKKNYEFPMGWIDKNELPIRAASRELLEETGYKTLIKPKKLMIFHPDPGRIENKIYCFYTDRIKRISNTEKTIKIVYCSKNEIIKLINKQKFNNASHIAAFYKYISKVKK